MREKLMQLPREVLVGEETLEKVTEICRGLGLKGKALVVADGNTYALAGKRVLEVLKGHFRVEKTLVGGATREEVEAIKSIVRKNGVSFLVSVGGGTVIDVAKLASKECRREFISVPTTASHDGIASSKASIKGADGSTSIEAHAPLGIIADTKVIRKAPKRFLASGCGDIIANYSAVSDWELANEVKGEEISEYSAALSLMTAKIIMDSCDTIGDGSEGSVRKVVKALISSGVAMSIAGSSRPASGSEHKFSHALDILCPKPALHGEQCGVGAIMMMYLHGEDWKRIGDALRKIGAPTNAKELEIEEEYIIKALLNAYEIRPERYTILEHKRLDERGAEKAARETGVIE